MRHYDVQYDPEFVEFIVREVIRRLTSAAPAAASSGELTVGERLITLATLHGKLDGVARVCVSKRAVVTPAVRDELSKRQIELKRQ